ncbi:MAG: DUF2842 domain-containing protein [Pseudomonadota bacterium]
MSPANRRLVASLVIIVFLAVWIWGAATLGTYLADGPKWLALIYFIVAGIGWALPLRPVLRWMNSGVEN